MAQFFSERQSRVGIRSVLAGVLVSSSLLFLLGALAGAFQLWRLDLTELPRLGLGFWLFASAAWIFSVFCGAYVSSASWRSSSPREGMIQGIVTWSAASLAFYAWSVLASGNFWAFEFSGGNSGFLFAVFFGDLIALASAVMGGRWGSYSEIERIQQEEEIVHHLAA